MSFVIRPAHAGDEAAILGLIQELADYEKLSHEVVATPEMLREHLFGESPVAECLLAETDKKSVGFALFFYNFSTFLGRPGIYLEDLYVQPDYRQRGIGKGLYLSVAQIAVERNCGRMEWSVLDWNEPSIEFYKSMSAVPMDEWTVYRLTGKSLQNAAESNRD